MILTQFKQIATFSSNFFYCKRLVVCYTVGMGKGTGACNERVSLQLDTPSSSNAKGNRYKEQENTLSGFKQSEPVVDKHGNKRWYNENGQLHREDGPATERDNGTKQWYKNGKKHREDGPAVESVDGQEWFLNGQRHRENGPAVEYTSGIKEWYLNNRLHRENAPAIEYANGTKEWWLHGKLQHPPIQQENR
jgi:hypothetical protein